MNQTAESVYTHIHENLLHLVKKTYIAYFFTLEIITTLVLFSQLSRDQFRVGIWTPTPLIKLLLSLAMSPKLKQHLTNFALYPPVPQCEESVK